MAEGVLFNIAEGVLGRLSSLAFQEIGLIWGVKDELDKLKDTVSTIRAVLLDAEEQQALNNQVKDWVEKLKEAVYAADELLDDFSTDALRREVMTGNRVRKEVRLFFSSSNQLFYGLKIGHKIKTIRERLDAIAVDRTKFQLEVRRVENSVTAKVRGHSDSSIPEVVVGREDDKKAIVARLLGSNEEEEVQVFPIVGLGGLGKTTLAQVIFNDEQVNVNFELKLWVCVSDTFDVKVIVKRILESATRDKVEDLEINTLKDKFHEKINEKRYLLVLDDIWDEDYERWGNLKKLLRGGAKGSKIIITTRSRQVADLTSKLQPHKLEGLSHEESWSLLKQIAFKGREPKSQKAIEIGKEIVENCYGVPLAIRTMGSLLCSKDSEAQLFPFLKKELSKLPQQEHDILPTLRLSYNYLPSHLKHCFAYCKLFPRGFKINVMMLIQLWIAQGFIKSTNPSDCLEDIGLEYFKDLLRRSFFQEVGKDKLGNIINCKMHDLMHHLAVLVGGVETISYSNNESVNQKTHHVSFNVGNGVDFLPGVLNPTLKANNLRTLLHMSLSSASITVQDCDAIFQLRHLLVLGLHKTTIDSIPSSIGKLKHLRYLDLSKNPRIKTLPSSITKLQNLQVLKLSNCTSLRELPRDINKLVNLKHLVCEGCHNLTHMPRGLGQLTSLQTLSQFVVAKSSVVSKHVGGLNELNGLNSLRGKIEIRNLDGNNSRIFRAVNLKEKQHLGSLVLNWNNSNNLDANADEMLFRTLQPHYNLKELIVRDYGGVGFPSWLSLLTNLVHIKIINCKQCQHLPPLDQMPSLRSLKFEGLTDLEYIEWEANHDDSVSEGGGSTFFPSLKTLEIQKCPKLKGWRMKRNFYYDDELEDDVDLSSISMPGLPQFPLLSRLEIRGCPELTWLPLFPTLHDTLWLDNTTSVPLQQTMEMKMATARSLSKLRTLKIQGIQDLETIPAEGLQGLASLRELRIRSCPNLATMPPEMRQLTSLQTLQISECHLLKERCGNKKGVDWPNIAHISNLSFK